MSNTIQADQPTFSNSPCESVSRGPSVFRAFASATSLTVVVRAAAAGSAFLMSVVVTRALGTHQAGLFFLGQTVLLLLSVGSRLGLDNVVVKHVAMFDEHKDSAAMNGVLLKAMKLVAPAAILLSLMTYLFAQSIATLIDHPEFESVLRCVAICIIPFSCFQLVSFGLQGSRRFLWATTISALLFPLGLLICAAVFDSAWLKAASLMRVAFAISLLNASLAAVLWFRGTGRISDQRSVSYRRLLKAAIPMFCITIVSYANTWTPQLILAGYADADQITILSVSQRTAALLSLLIIPINSVASPTYAAMYAKNQMEELRLFARKVNGSLIMASVPFLLILIIFSEGILQVFGSQVASHAMVLRVLVLGQLLSVITGSGNHLLMMTNHEASLRNVTALSAVFGIAASFGLIPSLGALGAAIAVACALLFYNVSVWFLLYQKLDVNVFRPHFELDVRKFRAVFRR